MKLIDKDALVAEIERLKDEYLKHSRNKVHAEWSCGTLDNILSFLDTLEVKCMDLEKLGEIVRHIIAVKGHIEDMRLDKEEWFMLEKIGYPEKFKAQKGE